MENIISKELLSFVFTDDQQDFEVIGLCPEDERLLEYIWIQEMPDYSGEGFNKVPMKINIHELAHKILDYAVSKKYVVSLVKVKEFWYCEYDTEEHYKYNGTMRKGQEDTKSDNPLKSASIMGQYILENKK